MKTCRKKPKRILAMFAVLAMTAGLFPVSGVTVPQAQAAEYGVSNPRIDSDGTVTWDCVYFGNYLQSKYTPAQVPADPVDGTEYMDSDGTKMVYKEWTETTYENGGSFTTTEHQGYFKVEPIKWRVLSVDGDDAFLLADQSLDCKSYKVGIGTTETTWATCMLRSWLNGYDASQNQESIDYSSDNFLDHAFTSEEQSAIQNTNDGDDTTDKIYLLSDKEAYTTKYGFPNLGYTVGSETREAKNTEYTKTYINSSVSSWWLRSPINSNVSPAFVDSDGGVQTIGFPSGELAVRPALHLNLTSTSVWSLGGTVQAEGGAPASVEWNWSCVYFGSYPQSEYTPKQTPENPVSGTKYTDSDGTEMLYKEWTETSYDENEEKITTLRSSYFKVEPIKWRVLATDGEDALLLADQNLDCQPYHTKEEDVTWETSTLRSWLNGYDSASNSEGTDYSANNFLNNAFNLEEQAAIYTTNVINENNQDYGTDGGEDTSDRVYLLSIAEAENEDYGLGEVLLFDGSTNDGRRAKSTAYAKACGVWTYTDGEDDRYDGNSWWWLRSPGSDSEYAAGVTIGGNVHSSGSNVGNDDGAVRPALHLNLSSTVWSSAGTVTSSGEVTEPAVTPTPAPVSTEEKADGKSISASGDTSAVTQSQTSITPVSRTTATTSGSPANAAGKAPSAVTGVKAKAKKKSAALSWKKVSGAKGYQIQYAANKKFKSAKTKTTSKTKLTIKKLKKGKTYYFRVRAYKKSGGKTVYGKWSAVKKAKVK